MILSPQDHAYNVLVFTSFSYSTKNSQHRQNNSVCAKDLWALSVNAVFLIHLFRLHITYDLAKFFLRSPLTWSEKEINKKL